MATSPITPIRPLNILYVAARLTNETGGPSASIPYFCSGLVRAGCHITLAMLGDNIADSVIAAQSQNVDVRVFPPTIHPSLYSVEMSRQLHTLARDADIIHMHGLWEYPNWLAGHIARHDGIPLIISTHGLLDPWSIARSRWKKRLAAALYADSHLHAAVCLHATAISESHGIRAYGLQTPIAVIPNGVDSASYRSYTIDTHFYQRFPACRNKRIVLFLSRVYPGKGVFELVKSWGKLADDFPDWHLVIAGAGEKEYLDQLQTQVVECGIASRTTYLGPLYGEEKIAAYAGADLFALPTKSENFGIVIAESLAAGTPVITTHGAPWAGLTSHQCGWWIPAGIPELTQALATAFSLAPTELSAMGDRGRTWVGQEFAWDSIAEQMLAVYNWTLKRGPMPPCVLP